jgi:hypothetical protein
MIDLAPSVGCPSEVHQSRACTLAAMARLTGHVVEMGVLPEGGRPDVLLVRPGDCSVFIGDAKATETPGNAETALRLSRYARFLARYVDAGGSGVFALVVAAHDRYGWLRVLRDVCVPVDHGRRVGGRIDVLDLDSAVVCQWFGGGRM